MMIEIADPTKRDKTAIAVDRIISIRYRPTLFRFRVRLEILTFYQRYVWWMPHAAADRIYKDVLEAYQQFVASLSRHNLG